MTIFACTCVLLGRMVYKCLCKLAKLPEVIRKQVRIGRQKYTLVYSQQSDGFASEMLSTLAVASLHLKGCFKVCGLIVNRLC